MNDRFYCYSVRMSSFGIKYISAGVNQKNGMKYHIFDKSDRLDKVIELYNRVKHEV